MGVESRKPSYINYDAIKFPGVGDYNLTLHSESIGRVPGKTIGLKI